MNDEIAKVIDLHQKWLNGHENGVRAIFAGLDLNGIDLSGVNLRGANFKGANLRNSDLRGSNFIGANFKWADLRNSDLRGANLRGANLRNSDLRGANLRDADLMNVNLIGVALTGTYLIIFKSLLWTAYINPYFIRIGHQCHSINQWRSLTDKEINKMHPKALEYWKENKSAIMAIAQSLEKREQPLWLSPNLEKRE